MNDFGMPAALLDATIPRTTTQRTPHDGGQERDALAWQREMERMQAKDWLSHPLVGYAMRAIVPAARAPQAANAVPDAARTPGMPASPSLPSALRAPPGLLSQTDISSVEGSPAQSIADSSMSSGVLTPAASHLHSRIGSCGHEPVPDTSQIDMSDRERQRAPRLDAAAAQPAGSEPRAAADPTAPFTAQAMRHALASFGNVHVTVQRTTAPAGAMPNPALAVGLREPTPMLPGGRHLVQQVAIAWPGTSAAQTSFAPAVNNGAAMLPEATGIDDVPPRAASPKASPPRAGAAADPADSDGMRVHAEWSAEGVRVWLGLDASNLPDAPAVARQLRSWLVAQGQSLLSVICNGRPVFESKAAAQPFNAYRNTRQEET